MKTKLIYLLFGIMLIGMIGLVSAETETYKINTPTNLQFTCTLNNAIPTAATFNITITNKNGNYLINNQLTNELGNGAFNYTVTFPKSEIYKIQMFCTDGTYSYSNEGYYNITPSGFSGTLGFYILILGLSFGVIILGFALKDAIIVILGSFGLYFIGLYILFFGLDGIKDPVYTWAIGIIILMLAAYISIRSAYELITD